jgi:hypothetical protein
MSTIQLRKVIQELNRVDLNSADVEHLVNLFKTAVGGVSIPVWNSSAIIYYRVRKSNTEPPAHIRELGAPPADCVNGYQRCNAPGRPMFYGASKRIIALLESRLTPGDVVYLGHWISSKKTATNSLLGEHPLKLNDLENMFYAYIDTIFTRPVHPTFSDHYKLTAAATRALSEGIGSGMNSAIGFMYPSVQNKYEGYNTAFPADVAASHLSLLHVTKMKIRKKHLARCSR